MIVDKICTIRRGNKFISYIGDGFEMDKKYILTYELHQITYPHIGYLFAFHKGFVKNFLSHTNPGDKRYAVLRCEAEVTDARYFCYLYGDFEVFWKNPDIYPERKQIGEGVLLCKWIKPVKILGYCGVK